MTSDDLNPKPCPWCGKKATCYDTFSGFYVACDSLECVDKTDSITEPERLKGEAIRAWNSIEIRRGDEKA